MRPEAREPDLEELRAAASAGAAPGKRDGEDGGQEEGPDSDQSGVVAGRPVHGGPLGLAVERVGFGFGGPVGWGELLFEVEAEPGEEEAGGCEGESGWGGHCGGFC